MFVQKRPPWKPAECCWGYRVSLIEIKYTYVPAYLLKRGRCISKLMFRSKSLSICSAIHNPVNLPLGYWRFSVFFLLSKQLIKRRSVRISQSDSPISMRTQLVTTKTRIKWSRFEPWRGYCVAFLIWRLYSHSASL